MAETNVELARRGYEAAARGDLDAIAAMLDPEVKWHGGDPSAEGACRNRDQALEFMRRRLMRAPGELVDVLDAGERVVVITRRAGTGGRAGALIANVTTFRDGKAIEMVHYSDPAEAIAAVGL